MIPQFCNLYKKKDCSPEQSFYVILFYDAEELENYQNDTYQAVDLYDAAYQAENQTEKQTENRDPTGDDTDEAENKTCNDRANEIDNDLDDKILYILLCYFKS